MSKQQLDNRTTAGPFPAAVVKIEEMALPRLSLPDDAVPDEQGCQFLRFVALYDLLCDNKGVW